MLWLRLIIAPFPPSRLIDFLRLYNLYGAHYFVGLKEFFPFVCCHDELFWHQYYDYDEVSIPHG